MVLENRKVWRTVLEVLKAKKMPPEDAREPSKKERDLMVRFIQHTFDSIDCSTIKEPGRYRVRRLNRIEYNNTLSDLIGTALRPADAFPPDGMGFGFDTIAGALTLSPGLADHYHRAAEEALKKFAIHKKGDDEPAARRIIQAFATRAFRRPVEKEQIERYLAIFRKARAGGDGFESSVRPMLKAVLLSPRFFLRVETTRPDAKGPYPVDAHALASRLSYFIWSSPPDAALLKRAADGSITHPDTLEAEARRMLAHPKSRQLAENFFGQWLQVRDLARHKPDRKQFPRFTDSLRRSMEAEFTLFVTDLIRKDRPIYELLDSKRTFLNQELANHYAIKGVTGSKMRAVTLKDPRRGGVLTMSAILTLTSDPQRTNIPRRGNYVAGRILGAPPAPPPPDVPALETSKKKSGKQTLRQILETHRKNPKCASCHAKIDPFGFALEPFDALGRARKVKDASGTLPDGSRIDGPAGLKRYLMKRKERFTKTLAENLTIYAFGRGLQYTDDCVIKDMVAAAGKHDGRFSSLVVALVRSYPFRHRRNPEF